MLVNELRDFVSPGGGCGARMGTATGGLMMSGNVSPREEITIPLFLFDARES